MAKLIFVSEKFAGRVYEFAVEKTTVGRGDHNTLTIHDPSVSQTHCEILVNGPEVIVRDLDSSNGTFVNGVRFHDQQRPLKSGQIVKFGAVEARLELEATSESDTDTDVTAMHSHARHVREQPEAAKKPEAASVTLDAGRASRPTDQTLMLPRTPQTGETVSPPSPQRARSPRIFTGRTRTILIVAALAFGLAILLWLILGRK
jgi:pSer/pThr/pTyr-binding forkhead associated (FHA) protein